MGKNEHADRIIILMLAVLFGTLLWVGWTVQGIRSARWPAPVRSGVTMEWTYQQPGSDPVKITLDLHVGETRAEWELRLREALDRAKDLR